MKYLTVVFSGFNLINSFTTIYDHRVYFRSFLCNINAFYIQENDVSLLLHKELLNRNCYSNFCIKSNQDSLGWSLIFSMKRTDQFSC